MSEAVKTYQINRARLVHALKEGFVLGDGASLSTDERGGRHVAVLGCLDSGETGSRWGRMRLRLETEGDVSLILCARACDAEALDGGSARRTIEDFLMDRKIPLSEKEAFFSEGGSRFVGQDDVLLFAQKGRRLWLWLEIVGVGQARLTDLCVETPDDSLWSLLPEVYRKEDDGFFRRFIGALTALYAETERQIDSLDRDLDPDSAGAPRLPELGSWLGLRLDPELLTETQQRALLKNAPALMKSKGTLRCIKNVISLLTDAPFTIAERRLNETEDPFGFTVSLDSAPDERLFRALRSVLGQFVPAGMEYVVRFRAPSGEMTLDAGNTML